MTALLSKTVSLAVAIYMPDDAPNSAGRVSVATKTPTVATIYPNSGNQGTEQFRWQIISSVPVPLDATTIQVVLYNDSAVNTASTTYYDRAILVEGDIPRDMA